MDGAFFERRSRVPTPDAGQAGPCLAGRCICQFCQSGGKRRWRDSNPQTFLRSPVFGTGCLPVSTHLHIVGRVGFEPTSPKATELQSACVAILHICRCCMSAVRGTRTLKTPLLRRVRIPFRHSCKIYKYLWRDSNPHKPGSLARCIFQFCYRGIFCFGFSTIKRECGYTAQCFRRESNPY